MKRKHSTLAKIKRGFTLVELVIVIAVIAILAAVLIPTFITVIDSANDSADTQLVANMNTVLSTEVYADETATAENLRKLLKENGLEADALQTKKSENIILYNQVKNRFEKVNLKNTKIMTEAEAASLSAKKANVAKRVSPLAEGEENALIIDPNPFSFAEIFEGYTIVSTGGNSLAEAVYGFYNTRVHTQGGSDLSKTVENFKALWEKICDIKIDNKDAAIQGFKKLINESVFVDCFDSWPGIRGATRDMAFITIGEDNKDVKVIGVDKENNSAPTIDGTEVDFSSSQWKKISTDDRKITTSDEFCAKLKVSPSRVFVPEASTKLDLYMFKCFFENAVVVISESIESVVNNGEIKDSELSGIVFLGNTEVLTEATDGDNTKLYGATVSSVHIQEVKENVKTFGANLSAVPYVSSDEADEGKPGYYTNLQDALNAAEKSVETFGLPRKVILASDYEIKSGTITIPANVTLHVPYSMEGGKFQIGQGAGEKTTLVDDELNGKDGYTYGTGFKKCTLTVASGASITVNGTLEIGAEMNSGLMTNSDAAYYNCVNGNYGQITNSGTITVAAGGRLNAYGYVKCGTEGKVIVNDGATVYDPIVITDMTSGNTLVSLVFPVDYNNRMFPFMRYALPNITKLEVNYGGLLSVMNFSVAMGGGESLIDSEGYFVGSDKNPAANDSLPYGGLLTLKSGGSVDITYEYKNAVKDENANNNLAGDIGVNKVTLHGNVQTGIVMSIASDIQNQILCWIPYNFEFEIAGDCTFTVTNKYAALPGAKVTVKNGGKLSVANGGAFYVVDSYNADGNLKLDGKSYPTAKMLTDAGFKSYAEFTLESGATFDVQAGAHVGGTIQATAGAKINVANGANLEGSFTIGADLSTEKAPNNNNKQSYNLPLKYQVGESEAKAVKVGETIVE